MGGRCGSLDVEFSWPMTGQVERNIAFISKKREGVAFSPKDTAAAASFCVEERAGGGNTLVKYGAELQRAAEQQRAALVATR